MSNFAKAMRFVARWEGGKVDDPTDRGGRTAFGVTQRTFDAYLAGKHLSSRDVWDIEPHEVDDIYRQMYWETARCELLPDPLDLLVFDSAVQHGPARAVRFLQQALEVPDDGKIGPVTLEAVHKAIAQERVLDVAEDYLTVRREFYSGLIMRDPSQARFSRGWTNRLAGLKVEAVGFA